MTKKERMQKDTKNLGLKARQRKRLRTTWIGVSIVLIAGVAMVVRAIQRPGGPGEALSRRGANKVVPSTAGPINALSLQPLVGRWARTDGPYMIEIRSAGDDGTLEAAYYNPRPIHVSGAEARDRKGRLEVFVELSDVNYPGSTYTLNYDRKMDQLQGIYYQAAMQQEFHVAFLRIRSTQR